MILDVALISWKTKLPYDDTWKCICALASMKIIMASTLSGVTDGAVCELHFENAPMKAPYCEPLDFEDEIL
jgi:hypothetical protein